MGEQNSFTCIRNNKTAKNKMKYKLKNKLNPKKSDLEWNMKLNMQKYTINHFVIITAFSYF